MRKLSEKQEQEICALYKSGLSSPKIAKQYNIHFCTVLETLRQKQIEIRSFSAASRKYEFNKNAWDLLTPESEYWLGFLMADGNVYKNVMQIKLQNGDLNHIKKLRDFLKSEHKISMQKGDNAAYFSIKSTYMVEKLAEYGIIPRKSKIAKASPSLINSINFWRGVTDGDGTFGVYKSRNTNQISFGLCGSEFLMHQFLDFIKTKVPNINSNVRPFKSIFVLNFGGQKALDIIKLLYPLDCVSLDRKYKNAQNILSRTDILLGSKGGRCGKSKLNDNKVKQIKRLKGTMLQKDIAKKFDVSTTAIYSIHNNKTWTHIQI